jgi:hypothetical protein
MPARMKTLTESLFCRLGSVNRYLTETDAGFVLIETGGSSGRADLIRELERTYCPAIAA